MTAEGRAVSAAPPASQGGGRTLARVVARDALGAGLRSRAAGRRREHQAREDLVRQATTPRQRQSQGPSPAFVRDRLLSLATTVAEVVATDFTPDQRDLLTAAAVAARAAADSLADTASTEPAQPDS